MAIDDRIDDLKVYALKLDDGETHRVVAGSERDALRLWRGVFCIKRGLSPNPVSVKMLGTCITCKREQECIKKYYVTGGNFKWIPCEDWTPRQEGEDDE